MFENIPNNWKKLEAEKYCFAVTDGTHDSPKPVEYNGIYLLTSKNITSGHLDYKNAYSISKEDFEKINKRSLVEKYDILFSMIGTVGESCIVDTDYINFAIKNVGLFKLNGDKIKAKWLNYFFKTANANLYIKQNLKGGNQKYIALNILRKFPIPVPQTLGEQQEIVDVLDAASAIIRLRTACIESAQSLIPALFQEMFSQYANSQNRTKLNYLFEFKSGGTPSKQVKEFFTGKIPWVTTIALNKLFIDQNDANELITEDAIKKSSTKLIPANSLLFGTRVGIGKLAINKVPMCTNQDIAALIPLKNNNLNLIYTYWYLKQINKFFVANGRGATIKGITTNLVKNTEIILPPMEQQELFAEKVQEIEAYIKTQQAELENAKTMFQSLLHHSFTGELTRRAYGE